MEHGRIRGQKKPRICQRCRTHGEEQLSTSEHRLSCKHKDCTCGRCQTIQRENLRHSEYNRRRRAEKKKNSSGSYAIQPYNHQQSPIEIALPPHHQAPGQPMYVVVPDNPAAGHSASSSHYVPSGSSSRHYSVLPPPPPASYLTARPSLSRPGHASLSYPTHAQSPTTMPAHSLLAGNGPSFYSSRSHHQAPQVTLGIPYPTVPTSYPQRISFTGPTAMTNGSPPVKRRHSTAAEEDRELTPEPPLKMVNRRTTVTSDDNDVFEQNGRHMRSPHQVVRSRSNLSSEENSADEDETGHDVVVHVQMSPPPLQSTERRADTSEESSTNMHGLAHGAHGAHENEIETPRHNITRARNSELPWSVRNDENQVSALMLVKILDQNPGLCHRMAYFYLMSSGGDLDKANERLGQLTKAELQQRGVSSNSGSSSCSSACSSSDESDIEVEDPDDRCRRLAALSKFGYRLGQLGEPSERVDDLFPSCAGSPEPSNDATRDMAKRARRPCAACKSWFSIMETNNTRFCDGHKL